MNLLYKCAENFNQLLLYQYLITIGRKGKSIHLKINFEPSDFHHLAGLHKLKDNMQLRSGSRNQIFDDILSQRLTLSQLQQSVYYSQIETRLASLLNLEKLLDNNQIIFRYNPKIQKFSMIQADFLFENSFENSIIYLFLSKRQYNDFLVCQSIFPKTNKDYSVGQPRYTLLKKEKVHTQSGIIIPQYNRQIREQ